MKTRILAAALAFAAILSSCKSQYEALLESSDNEQKYQAAFSYYRNGKYQKAAQLFESLSTMTSGTQRDDTVHFFWGKSNYNQRDYLTAESNFAGFIETYPRSVFVEEATFLHLDCLFRESLRWELDQAPSRRCIAAIGEFLADFPQTDKREVCTKMLADLYGRLERKAFENARIYYKMEDYKASRVALRNVLKENSETSYREQVLYLIAMSSYKYALLSVPSKQKERYLVFIDDYYNFIGEYPESSFRKELDSLYAKVKK